MSKNLRRKMNLKGLNYEEVKEKVEALRKQLKVAASAIKKHGYASEKTEKAFEVLADLFMEFKWTPQYLKKLSSIIPMVLQSFASRKS